MSNFLPCPFCGSDYLRAITVTNTGGNTRYIQCFKCSAAGPWFKSTDDPTEKWNKRDTVEITLARNRGWKQCDYPHASAKDMWTHDDLLEGKYISTEEMLEFIEEERRKQNEQVAGMIKAS